MTGRETGDPSGVVVALCTGHRCAALTHGDGGLGHAVSRSAGGILVSAPCLQQCAHGAVGAVALRAKGAGTTGPSVWLGGLDDAGRLEALGRWVEGWRCTPGAPQHLPEDLHHAVLGTGPPVRLTRD